MTRIVGLDLSKTATGFAAWSEGQPQPLSGYWNLGSEYSSSGRVFCNLHRNLEDLHSVGAIDVIYYEGALDPRVLSGHTNIETLKLMSGLAAHVESWAAARQVKRTIAVNQTTWRRHFIGPMKRGTKSVDLKEYAMLRCREFGLAPKRHDEAEAIGVLSYAMSVEGMAVPWEALLRAPLGRVA